MVPGGLRQGAYDEVGGGVGEVGGERAQRVGQPCSPAYRPRESLHLRADGLRCYRGGGGDCLLQASGRGQGVAQQLGPGSDRLDPGGRADVFPIGAEDAG